MKAAIYNPYLDSLGGGERYTLSFANLLLQKDYRVDLQWKDEEIINKLEKRFGFSLKNINTVPDIKRGDGYDLCFWVSDGSIPLLRSRKNILHFQFPFKNVSGKSILNKMKLIRINKIICNSKFTKNFIDAEFSVNSQVIYPPVDVSSFKAKRKENIIIYIGRFSNLTQAKNQHQLIENFKKFFKKGYPDWKLILAGGTEVGADEYLLVLEKLSKGYPIEIIKSPEYRQLKELVGKAKIFWSAVGYGINEDKEPTKVEHFGISVVEAMAAGAIPLVYSAGGSKEIIKDNFSGFLWRKQSELINKTLTIIKDKRLLADLSKNAIAESKQFSTENFNNNFSTIIE